MEEKESFKVEKAAQRNAVKHETVLLHEAIESLVTDKNGFYIDGTFGRGGHSRFLLDQLGNNGRVLAFDRDPQAIQSAQEHFAGENRLTVVHSPFSRMRASVDQYQMSGQVPGVLLDLGVSSPQLDQSERGFSFMRNGPLDMRMDPTQGISAADWLATEKLEEMARIFKAYGEERFAKRIAGAIISEREKQPIVTTERLSQIVTDANPAWEKHKHPATRVFQAIRIYINDELGELEAVLDTSLELLAVGGRLVVISFHSLEDRIVKRFIKKHAKGDALPASIPITDDQLNRRFKIIGKTIKASDAEVEVNPRSRSAIMRVAEKLK